MIAQNFKAYLLQFVVLAAAAVVAGSYLYVLSDVVVNGWSGLNWSFLSEAPSSAGRKGGLAPIILSTLYILVLSLSFTVPIGLGAAIYLAEYNAQKGQTANWVRYSLDVLAGIPSIVFGLFGNLLFCQILGFGFSILSGALTLSCMILPLFIRTTEEAIRLVPREWKWAGFAAGLRPSTTLFKVVLPVAAPGIAAGLVLAMGRALAETAALIFTSGYVDRFPESALDSGRALSVHIYDLAMNVPGGNANAYKSACVLIVVLLISNYLARASSRYWVQRKLKGYKNGLFS